MTPRGSVNWVRSSYSSQDGGNCVEWAPTHAQNHGVVPIRDSKTPYASHLTFSAPSWSTFVQGIKGEAPF
ncbi:DUF397 domain-containing protein [Streptomyces sp. NPDC091292]|uniref:DUF397 domain-containing protein n=1 Tax=Streptomyces sp. NPDC091292 TaxID=3365991 RepID=UPI0037FD1A92